MYAGTFTLMCLYGYLCACLRASVLARAYVFECEYMYTYVSVCVCLCAILCICTCMTVYSYASTCICVRRFYAVRVYVFIIVMCFFIEQLGRPGYG